MKTYKEKVNAAFFRQKYPTLPADAIVQDRIRMATKYAGIEGGISSSAYNAALLGTFGTAGGGSPLTVPAAIASFGVDLTYTSQLQIQLAYDISILYNVPLDLNDPQDCLRFINIAFGIRATEPLGNAALKGIPAIAKPIIKKIYSKGTLTAAKSIPVVGKYLLQRNVIKFATPAISIPATIAVNRWMTKTDGQKAAKSLRNEARIIETANRMVENNKSLKALLWAIWLVMDEDEKISENERDLVDRVSKRIQALDESDVSEKKTSKNSGIPSIPTPTKYGLCWMPSKILSRFTEVVLQQLVLTEK